MTADIKVINGKVTLNGKTYDEMDYDEKEFLDGMFREIKFEAITMFQ